jgi:hypothetical protein
MGAEWIFRLAGAQSFATLEFFAVNVIRPQSALGGCGPTAVRKQRPKLRSWILFISEILSELHKELLRIESLVRISGIQIILA